jgi:CRISPR-associated DxTHG motif protein
MPDDDSASSVVASSERMHAERWLITFLGLNPQSVRYELDGKQAEARHAALALLELLGDQAPQAVRVLGTTKSLAETWPDLKDAFEGSASDVEFVELKAVDDPDQFLTTLIKLVKGRKQQQQQEEAPLELVLDLTHGFRHLPMLAYAGALYLAALRPEVKVVGCWHGMLDNGQGRFINLLPLVELPEWLNALRLLEERGDGTRLAALLQQRLPNELGAGDDRRKCAKELNNLALSLAWRCPLDAALAAQVMPEPPKRLGRVLDSAGVVGAGEIKEQLGKLVERYAPTEAMSGNSKPGVTKETLGIHASMIDAAFVRDDLPGAVGLLREWLVSWVWWVEQASEASSSKGLDRGERQRASGLLGALAAMERDESLSGLLNDTQKQIGSFWRDVCETRNALLHNGMRPQSVLEHQERGKGIRSAWEGRVKKLLEEPNVELRPQGRQGVLLVSPLGRTPGVVQAALACCDPRPQRLLVVTSAEQQEQARSLAATQLVQVITLVDPYRGVSELNDVVEQATKAVALAEQVRVNLTGGTTLLGVAAERIAQAAERLEVEVRRFVLVESAVPSDESSLVWVDDAERS